MSAFITFAQNLFTQGNQLLDYLAKFQSESIVKELYSQARELRDEKVELRKQFAAGTIADGEKFARVHRLESPTRQMIESMRRFGSQIESVTNLSAGPLLSTTSELLQTKLDSLSAAAKAYKSDDPTSREMAARQLDSAISDIDGVMDAAKCLLDTIQGGKLACDKDLKHK